MITIGLTGWGDHPTITLENSKKLENYSSYFPVVELDTSFYAIPPQKNISSWIEKTPEAFQFIPKAYKAMTQHKEWIEEFSSVEQMFEIFNKTFEPMVVSNKVKAFFISVSALLRLYETKRSLFTTCSRINERFTSCYRV